MGARTFVVVGGTSGLGLAVARLLVDEDRVVVLGDVPDEVAATADEVGCDGTVCDTSSYEQVRDAFARVVDRYGTIDGVAACASMWIGGDLADLSSERIRRAVEVNALGTTYVFKEALDHMHRQGFGNVVYVGAMAVTKPRPGIPVYRATKSYGSSLVESLAEAQHSNRVKVMQLHPGPMPTRLQERVGDDFLDEVYALPEQVATEVVRLVRLAPDDLYVSGERVLRADGRW
ncbi:SDR family NAD(P)-dependent oxidoreductase [Micromonospora sp. WMMD812]|uniref:SDR family NAD(P)-dependent oxidoreductase n=1 Tax=Micromonospora sp. WMMD812 TaxID=3015152 RepID=UPI00248C76E9|nr:SDR family NAD(P)-dependent oxidoreductase [Micromonospora sp. WMMD812]WBB69982.1 SDR family NAD(P)-dependent oxidoreductase [Micromonospora sp. WMMD812]